MPIREAACACGQLKVACEGEPVSTFMCHCLECQRRTGSLFGMTTFFPCDRFSKISGEATAYKRGSDAGYSVTNYFCPICGATVYWEPERMPDCVAVAVGAFADPDFPAPEQSVWNAKRHRWFPLLPQIAKHHD